MGDLYGTTAPRDYFVPPSLSTAFTMAASMCSAGSSPATWRTRREERPRSARWLHGGSRCSEDSSDVDGVDAGDAAEARSEGLYEQEACIFVFEGVAPPVQPGSKATADGFAGLFYLDDGHAQ